ncbi:MAG: CsgG/HfaB family protein [Armatimonadota bacterium]|nr:penicillin-binding protein activator LpoB [bacterium]MDW8321932.1 CsgG/HfaB family protein [Armatimonadota bacterium]
MNTLFGRLSCCLLLVIAISGSPVWGDTQSAFVLAVSDFTGDSPTLCQAVTETVLTDLAKSRKLTLVERTQLRQALSELRLQKTGLTETSEMARAGRIIGATHVVVGSVSLNEQRVILNARVLDVRTGAVYAGAAVNTEGWSDEVFTLAHELANRLHHQLTGESLPGFADPSPQPATTEPPAATKAAAPATPSTPPDWENLPESAAIAYALLKGWMRLYADGSFRPYEPVTERYFYETLRRLARRYQRDDTRYFPSGDGSGKISRIEAARVLGTLVTGKPAYFLDVPDWAAAWLGNAPHQPLTRAQFAVSLQLAEQQLQCKITSTAAVPSVPAGAR